MATEYRRPPGSLPERTTRFFGHADEVARLALTLDDHAVVTVTGPGGVGKTSVAIEVARRLADYFPDGVWFVNLALLDEKAGVVPFVCETLREIAPLSSDAASFAAALDDRRALVIFDSCEHVLPQMAELVATIAANAPQARIVVTSRQPLNIEAEFTHRLGTLGVDDAVGLFLDRAAIAGVNLSMDDAPVVTAIVQRLDAMPLAIELAAPQLAGMSIQELLARIDDRLGLLALENPGAERRQQTLEAMHDWSHRLLSADAQMLFSRLAIFVGGFTLESAMLVCADDTLNEARLAEALDELARKSLVVVDELQQPRRYRMLESTRAYAQGLLFQSNEYDAAAQAHVHTFLLLARRFAATIEGMPALEWVAMVTGEAQNFRAALTLALDAGDIDSAAAICEALFQWLWSHGAAHAGDLREGIGTLLATVLEPRVEAPLRLAYAALLRQTDRNEALESARRSWELYAAMDEPVCTADALRATNTIEHDVFGAATSRVSAEVERFAEMMLERGYTLHAAELLNVLGINYVEMIDESRMPQATECFERAAALLEARGDRERAGRVIGNSAVTAYLGGDRELAVRLSRRAVRFFEHVPDCIEAGHQWNNLGFHLTSTGRYDEAHDAIVRSIRIACDRNDREGLAEVLESAAQYHRDAGDARVGAWLLGAASTLIPGDLARQAREVGVLGELYDGLRARLGEGAFEEAYRRGAALPAAQIVREARALSFER